jgi:hypothetical protein
MTPPAERHVRMAARLYKLRDTARQLLGNKYHERTRDLGVILQQTADKRCCSVVEVATEVCRDSHLHGIEEMLVMAAAVEVVDPSPKGGAA